MTKTENTNSLFSLPILRRPSPSSSPRKIQSPKLAQIKEQFPLFQVFFRGRKFYILGTPHSLPQNIFQRLMKKVERVLENSSLVVTEMEFKDWMHKAPSITTSINYQINKRAEQKGKPTSSAEPFELQVDYGNALTKIDSLLKQLASLSSPNVSVPLEKAEEIRSYAKKHALIEDKLPNLQELGEAFCNKGKGLAFEKTEILNRNKAAQKLLLYAERITASPTLINLIKILSVELDNCTKILEKKKLSHVEKLLESFKKQEELPFFIFKASLCLGRNKYFQELKKHGATLNRL
ncbi:hypothetical protein AB751O23_CP_00040 [Chlamydiales bacterium SCGC AB-751-O23]|jgi:hypothetical protein|nr:hypothetical protein AB751O23_CP_00040 [Chlamydiales bacterium SCGC AB-751-O23]